MISAASVVVDHRTAKRPRADLTCHWPGGSNRQKRGASRLHSVGAGCGDGLGTVRRCWRSASRSRRPFRVACAFFRLARKSPARTRVAILLLCAVVTAASTLLIGPLCFVGLMALHPARKAVSGGGQKECWQPHLSARR
ncbi:iron chelate uptake ABC transporter family permease subunit [Rhizobium sp. 21-4511-3d]